MVVRVATNDSYFERSSQNPRCTHSFAGAERPYRNGKLWMVGSPTCDSFVETSGGHIGDDHFHKNSYGFERYRPTAKTSALAKRERAAIGRWRWIAGTSARSTRFVQRGRSGDKGRDIVVWLDPPSTVPRRWRLYQCKHYDDRLGAGVAAAEIGKVLYYTSKGDYSAPQQYWFVTHKGVTGDLQDLLDDP